MFELKVAGSVLVAVFAGLLGLALQNDMKQRILLLQDFYKGIRMIHQEIDYLKAPLGEALQHAGREAYEPLDAFFKEVGESLERLTGASFLDIWETGVWNYLENTPLKPEDLEVICQLGSQLSGLNPGGSKGMLTVLEQRMEALTEEARAEYGSKAQLYGRLGVIGGIFLVILLL